MVYAVELKLAFDADARKLHESVEMDNGDFISSSVDGHKISARAESDNLMSLLRTVDDFISCLQIAEKTLKKIAPP